jgi:hypothetical protein
MSAWILLVKRLHQLGGGPLRVAQFDIGATPSPQTAMAFAKSLGVVEDLRVNRQHGESCIWRITPLGVAFCEGRFKVSRAARLVEVRR